MTVWIRETVRNLNSKVSSRPLPEPFQMTLRIDTRVHIYTYIYIHRVETRCRQSFVGQQICSHFYQIRITIWRYTHTYIYYKERERRKKENGVKFVVDYRERYYINRFELRFVSGSSRRLDAARTMRSRRVSNGS